MDHIEINRYGKTEQKLMEELMKKLDELEENRVDVRNIVFLDNIVVIEINMPIIVKTLLSFFLFR